MIGADERTAMQDSVQSAIANALKADAAADVDAVLAQLGWRDMLAEEPGDAIGIVFGALGATNASATALDDVLGWALGGAAREDCAVLLPAFDAWDPPGRIEGGGGSARGLATARVSTAREMLVACGAAGETRIAAFAASELQAQPVRGIDPDAGLREVRLRFDAARADRLDPAAWQAALALGRRAVAHQIAGASRAMLELACRHARERSQFGRPIARFQAVRHRLADALVAVEALDASLVAARETPDPDTAALAKAVAGRTARTVATHCQQVLAGIGFTTEHPFHRFLARVLVLEGLFGSADAIALDVGRRLLASRRVPTLIEL
jgi:hypothetical protein